MAPRPSRATNARSESAREVGDGVVRHVQANHGRTRWPRRSWASWPHTRGFPRGRRRDHSDVALHVGAHVPVKPSGRFQPPVVNGRVAASEEGHVEIPSLSDPTSSLSPLESVRSESGPPLYLRQGERKELEHRRTARRRLADLLQKEEVLGPRQPGIAAGSVES